MVAKKINKHILIVDDEDDVRIIFSMMLKRRFEHCSVAKDGQEALSFIQKNDNLDCIITDISMPEMDGFELKSHIDKIRPNVAVVAVTGHSDGSTLKRLEQAGFSAVLVKPLTREKITEIAGLFL